MAKLTPKEIKAEIKEQKGIMKASKTTVQEFFKGDHDIKVAKAAVGNFAKADNKVKKLMEKLEAE